MEAAVLWPPIATQANTSSPDCWAFAAAACNSFCSCASAAPSVAESQDRLCNTDSAITKVTVRNETCAPSTFAISTAYSTALSELCEPSVAQRSFLFISFSLIAFRARPWHGELIGTLDELIATEGEPDRGDYVKSHDRKQRRAVAEERGE